VNDTNHADIEKAASPTAPQMAAACPDAYSDGEPVPYTLTARAEAVLASWDRCRQAGREAGAGQ
jgi:hypothetical protein